MPEPARPHIDLASNLGIRFAKQLKTSLDRISKAIVGEKIEGKGKFVATIEFEWKETGELQAKMKFTDSAPIASQEVVLMTTMLNQMALPFSREDSVPAESSREPEPDEYNPLLEEGSPPPQQ